MPELLRRQWIYLATALTLVLGLVSFIGSPATVAQDGEGLSGAPVDIHEGSCDDYLTEPAYDAGDTEVRSLNELRDSDDFDDDGLLEQDNAVGVDLNNDATLNDTEIIGAAGDDAQVAVAEAELDEGIAEDGDWVAVVHSSPDAYDTALACGSLNNAEEAEDGDMVVPVQPVDDSGYFGYSVMNGDRTNVTTYIFSQGTAPQSGGSSPEASAGYPIDIHQGTCTDWTFEPAYDVGEMLVTNVGADGEQEVGDTEAEVPEAANVLGDVYHVDGATDFTGNELLEEQEGNWVVAVHESEDNYETLVACGPILDIPENDNTIVPLLPVGDSNMTGVAQIANEGDGAVSAFLWNCEPMEQAEFPTPTPTPEPTNTPTPSPTPEPTNTPTPIPTTVVEETEVVTETEVVEVTEVVEATEVIEVTEVVTETEVVEETEIVTETEVVLAPTATALAQEGEQAAASGQQQQEFDLNEEPEGELTSSAGGSFIVTNTSENDRTFQIDELGIDETVASGDELEVILPEDVEAGTYPYEVLEDDETVFDGELVVE